MPSVKSLGAIAAVSLLSVGALLAQDPLTRGYVPRDAPPSHDDQGDPIVYNCVIDPVESIEVPATDPGVLVHQGMKQGSRVRAEDVIAKIDAREPETERRIAQYERDAKIKQAKDDIEIRYARAAAAFAKEDLEGVLKVIDDVEKAVTDVEVNKAKLDYERSRLAIEKAEKDQELARLDAWTAQARMDAAQMKIDRRTIRAPWDGIVMDVQREQQEWVNPGDTIVRLARLDALNVEGTVQLAHHSPAELAGCEVTVIAEAGRGRKVEATGRIVNVYPEVIAGQKIAVRAEVVNHEENGQWLIFPRMKSRMIIHLGTGGVAVGSRE